MLAGEHLVATVSNNQIILADTQTPISTPVYTMKGDEIIPVFELFDIKVSPSKDYLVWYTPLKGLLALDMREQSVRTLKPANAWLNTNPFFDFDTDRDRVFMVDDEGTNLFTIDVATGRSEVTSIPFPYGTIFKISPDRQNILFISAFGQTVEVPEFMYTTINGEDPVQFDTDTLLTQRHMVEWLPDSSGVVMISGDESSLTLVPLNSTQPQVFYEHPMEGQINRLEKIEDKLLYYTSTNRWHVIDPETLEEVGRIPREIAEEIHRPRFIPWYDKTFLIEETLRWDPEQYKRLWVSDYMGIKKLVFDEYDQVVIETSGFEI